MAKTKHILALRFSALGDVAMTVPVIHLLLQQYPDLHVTIATPWFHRPMFKGLERLHFFAVDLKGRHAGMAGLLRLASDLKKVVEFDAVADLHDVLRTKVLRSLLWPVKTSVIKKGRKEKKELIRAHNKKLRPLRSGFQRYADVFKELGYPVDLDPEAGIVKNNPISQLSPLSHEGKKFVGIAPFARHDAKMFPLQKMERVLDILSGDKEVQLFLFGSPQEAQVLKKWADKLQHVELVAGKYTFEEELSIIARMDVMLSMDSANMHLASMYGVPVVSIWGGTHPFLGFYGWGQDLTNAVQLDMPCRPSSVYGKRDCPVHGKAGCMEDISPAMVVERVRAVLGKP